MTSDRSPRQEFIRLLREISERGGETGRDLGKISKVFDDVGGMTSTSRHSLQRAERGESVPRGNIDRLRVVLVKLANGKPDAVELIEQTIMVHKLAMASSEVPNRPANNRAEPAPNVRLRDLPQTQRAAAEQFILELSRLCDRTDPEKPSTTINAAWLARTIHCAATNAKRMLNYEIGVPPERYRDVRNSDSFTNNLAEVDKLRLDKLYRAAYAALYDGDGELSKISGGAPSPETTCKAQAAPGPATDQQPQSSIHDILLAATERRCGVVPGALLGAADPTTLHQPIRVHRRGRAGSNVPADGVENGTKYDAGQAGDTKKDTKNNDVFLWLPERVPWPHVIVVGGPGYGKSWLLRYHVRQLAKQASAQSTGDCPGPRKTDLPLLLEAAALAVRLVEQPTVDEILDALTQVIRRDTLGHLTDCPTDELVRAELRAALREGRLLLGVDALDEVPGAEVDRLRQALTRLAGAGCRTVITSRRTIDLDSVDTVQVELLGFSLPADRSSFVYAWFGNARGRAAKVDRQLSNPELRQLATVPLFTALLCRLAAAQEGTLRTLPKNPVDLVHEAAISLLTGDETTSSRLRFADMADRPDGRARLALLSNALGGWGYGWRSNVEPIPADRLEQALTSNDAYPSVAKSAQIRWDVWQRSVANPIDRTSDVVLWEFLLDGLLVEYRDRDGARSLRFVHAMFRDLCLALHAANSDLDQQWGFVDRHRWFDAEWRPVIPMLVALSRHADEIVSRLCATEGDAWHDQLLLAVQCIAARTETITRATTEHILDELVLLCRSSRSFDHQRAFAAFETLLAAGHQGSRQYATQLLTDHAVPTYVRQRVAFALCRAGDSAGLLMTARLVVDDSTPSGLRRRAAEAILLLKEGVKIVSDALVQTRYAKDQAELAETLTVGSADAIDAATSLVRDPELPRHARAAIALALARSGRLRGELAGSLVTDQSLGWKHRAYIGVASLHNGFPLSDTLTDLLGNPNLTKLTSAVLAVALLDHGVDIVDRASLILGDSGVHWECRRDVASALARFGPSGVEKLVEIAQNHDIEDRIRLRALAALIEAEQPVGVVTATELAVDRGVEPWIRVRCIKTLVRDDQQIDSVVFDELLDEELAPDYRRDLLEALLASGVPGAADRIRETVAEMVQVGGDSPNWTEIFLLLEMLGRGGSAEWKVVEQIATDSEMVVLVRIAAVSVLGRVVPDSSVLVDTFREELSPHLVSRLAVLLGRAGLPAALPPLLAALEKEEFAYEPLFHFANAAPLLREELLVVKDAVATFMNRIPDGSIASDDDETTAHQPRKITLNREWLESLGFDFPSDFEARRRVVVAYAELEQRVGTYLSSTMLPEETETFEQSRLEGEEVALVWITNSFPGFREVVREQYDLLEQELQERASQQRDKATTEEKIDPITLVLRTTEALLSWVQAGSPDGSRMDLKRTQEFHFKQFSRLSGAVASNILDLSLQITEEPLPYRPFRFLHWLAEKHGLNAAYSWVRDYSSMLDYLRDALDDGNSRLCCDGGLLACMMYPEDGASWFYAAIGAAAEREWALANRMMARSRQLASAEQRATGIMTINEVRTMYRLDADRAQELVGVLMGDGAE